MAAIGIEEFRRVDMRIGIVRSAERVAGTDKLLKLRVDFGVFEKHAVAGLGHLYPPEHFIGKKYAFVVNLQPKRVRGETSECMLLAAVESENEISPIVPERDVREGAQVF